MRQFWGYGVVSQDAAWQRPGLLLLPPLGPTLLKSQCLGKEWEWPDMVISSPKTMKNGPGAVYERKSTIIKRKRRHWVGKITDIHQNGLGPLQMAGS